MGGGGGVLSKSEGMTRQSSPMPLDRHTNRLILIEH
jgi:hypothetical protein